MLLAVRMAEEIRCVFFSEFHHIAGPRISYQVPESFQARETFDAVHDLIITKPKLYNRLISLDVAGHKIVGCPKGIDDKKYERNVFIFNFVFVFDSSTDTTPYEPVIQKLGDAFKTYELESSFLSTEETRSRLPEILNTVMNKLNSCGFCTIPIDETNCLHLKITPTLQEPPEVCDYHVPIFTCTREDIENTSWDLTIEQILPYINGFNHVKKIAHESEVNIGIATVCIQHLALYGFLKLISIFQYSNMYACLPKVQDLLTNSDLQRECLEYVALPGSTPHLTGVFRLYCSLEAGLTVRDLCMRNELSSMGVNERTLVQFGLMRGLIRHLQKYPVLVKPEEPLPPNHLIQYLDGSHCFDEICCALAQPVQTLLTYVQGSGNETNGVSNQELDNLIDSCSNVVVCWK